MKTCTKCKVEQPLSDFYWSNRRDHYSNPCKACKKAYATRMKKENPRWHADRVRKSKYGITAEEWNDLFASQGFCCAICKTTEPCGKVGWHTDHDHITNRVRGILCLDCNVVVGKIENGWKVEIPAINQYLEFYSQQGGGLGAIQDRKAG